MTRLYRLLRAALLAAERNPLVGNRLGLPAPDHLDEPAQQPKQRWMRKL